MTVIETVYKQSSTTQLLGASSTSRAQSPLRVLLALPGLHKVTRGAEVAMESIAAELARTHGVDVTVIGCGLEKAGSPYRFIHVGCIGRERFERWPSVPVFRNEYAYEEMTYVPGLLRRYIPSDYDVTIACSYPFTNWALRAKRDGSEKPAHVFVTQNGDWPAQDNRSEYRYFGCDGLVCTNPEYYERNRDKWHCTLIPNGVDPDLYCPGSVDRKSLGLPANAPVVLMVSALIESKRVLEGIRSVAPIDEAYLVVAGDGPLRAEVEELGEQLMPGRFERVTFPRERMPDVYRAADVFLHMSQIEPSANAYIEALASGVPIVTHDRYVTQWTLENEASLVDTNNLNYVTDAVRDTISDRGPGSVDSRRDLVQRRFAWSSIAGEYLRFLQDVCNRVS